LAKGDIGGAKTGGDVEFGLFNITAGVAILTKFRARLAAILLTVMYAGFGILVHAPMLLADPSNPGIRAENALNLALIGVAWVVADSLARARRRRLSDWP
jgi:uncharacterized membrane protein YphA (DoxX/SURF4 family)